MTIKEASKLVKVTSTVENAEFLNSIPMMRSQQKNEKVTKVDLFNPDIDYSAPLPQQINPDLIGAHPHTALHQQQYNNSINNKNSNCNQAITQQQQLLLTQLKQQAQQQQNFAFVGAQNNLQHQISALVKQQQAQQQNIPSLKEENKMNFDSNIMKMWQQEKTTELSHLLKDIMIDDGITITTNNENRNIYINNNSSINNNQFLKYNADVKNIQQRQQHQTNMMINNNNINNSSTNEISNLWGSAFASSSESSFSSNASNCSSSSLSSSSPTTSSGCSSGGTSSISPTASYTAIANSNDNNTETSLSIIHAVKNCGKESLWQQALKQQLSPTTSNKLREIADNGNNRYKTINAIDEYENKNIDINYDNLWSIGSQTKNLPNTNNNDHDTLSQYAKISNIWQLPNMPGPYNENKNVKLYTDLWKNIDNVCDTESPLNPSQLLDPAGIWRLDSLDMKNQSQMNLFGDMSRKFDRSDLHTANH